MGSIKIRREYVPSQESTHHVSHVKTPYMFTFHTNIRNTALKDEDIIGTLAMLHGFGENSDLFLESGLQFALNGFDVHLIDLRGFGQSGGSRMTINRIQDYHLDVTTLLKLANP